jgi:hypothetical protein
MGRLVHSMPGKTGRSAFKGSDSSSENNLTKKGVKKGSGRLPGLAIPKLFPSQ